MAAAAVTAPEITAHKVPGLSAFLHENRIRSKNILVSYPLISIHSLLSAEKDTVEIFFKKCVFPDCSYIIIRSSYFVKNHTGWYEHES